MQKEITLGVPRYVRKFVMSHPDYEIDNDGAIFVPKISELGRLIQCVSRVIPYTQKAVQIQGEPLLLRYTCRTKAFDVPVEKYREIARFLDQSFRSSLVREVSAIQTALGDPDYSWMVRQVLTMHGVVVDDDQTKDMEFDTARKIYRDHLTFIEQKNAKKRPLFMTVLSAS